MNDPRQIDNRSFHISSTPYVVHIALTANTTALDPPMPARADAVVVIAASGRKIPSTSS